MAQKSQIFVHKGRPFEMWLRWKLRVLRLSLLENFYFGIK